MDKLLKELILEHERLGSALKARKDDRGMDFYVPNPVQYKAHCSLAKVIAIVKGNRMGGSTWGSMEVTYAITKKYPDWFPFARRFNRPIKIRIATDKFFKIDSVIEPKLRQYLPKDEVVRVRRSPQGYISKMHCKDGSTIEFLTSEQDQMAWEGQDLDLFWGDEPMKRSHWVATKRGLLDRAGQAIFSFTPLIEPWMKEEIVDKIDKDIEVFYGTTRDNLFDIKGNPILKEEDIQAFENILTEDEKETRIHGKFFHLKGIVYKEFNQDVHVVRDFRYEPNYPVVCVLDPHDRLPHWIIWAMIDRTNDIIVMYELVKEGTISELAGMIRATEKYFGWNVVKRIIDPNFGRKPLLSTGMSVINELAKNRCYFTEADDNKETGRLVVKEYLHYDPKKPLDINNRPKIYFVGDKVSRTIHSLRNLQHDEWKGGQDRDPKEDTKPKDEHGADCYTEGTEVLTSEGWKDFKDVKIGQSILTYNIETETSEYQECLDIIAYQYNGKILKIDAPHIDLEVTANHNLVVDRSRLNKLDFCKAQDIRKTHRFKISSMNYIGNNNKFILQPIILKNNYRTRKWGNTLEIDLGDWAEFMGWYISEGSCSGTKGGKIQIPGRGYEVIISQSEIANKEKVERIKELLKKLPFRFRYDGINFKCSNIQLWQLLVGLGNSSQKRIPRYLLNSNREVLNRLWESLILGDGWKRNSEGRIEREIYATVSEGLSDDIQELLLKLGFSSSVTKRTNRKCLLSNSFDCQDQYYIYKNQSDYAVPRDSESSKKYDFIDYDGMVYCVTVPNHTLWIRRNNKIVLCGNCVRYLCISRPTYSLPNTFVPQEAFY